MATEPLDATTKQKEFYFRREAIREERKTERFQIAEIWNQNK
jgi:hypothetical protein